MMYFEIFIDKSIIISHIGWY